MVFSVLLRLLRLLLLFLLSLRRFFPCKLNNCSSLSSQVLHTCGACYKYESTCHFNPNNWWLRAPGGQFKFLCPCISKTKVASGIKPCTLVGHNTRSMKIYHHFCPKMTFKGPRGHVQKMKGMLFLSNQGGNLALLCYGDRYWSFTQPLIVNMPHMLKYVGLRAFCLT